MKRIHAVVFIFAVILLVLAGAVADQAFAATGIPKIISYQGRLLNASGTLLGGSGTTYCFRFSLYNASSGGAQIWPAATASIMSATVANGVFDIGVGDTSAGGDALTYNFQDSDTVYLNVQVATLVDAVCTGGSEVFETLSPRERVVASGYAINSYSVNGFTAATNASGTQIPVISSDTLTLAGTNPEINATGTNTLTLQGGPGTGAIQFFSANNFITSTTLRMAGTVSANALQMALSPSQASNVSLLSLGQSFIRNGAASGTFIGINTSGTYNGDYLEFEDNSSTVFEVASSGQLTIGTTTNISNSLLFIASSSNIFTVMSSGNVGIGTTTPGSALTVAGSAYVANTSTFLGNMTIGTSTLVSNALLSLGTSSNILAVLTSGNVGIGTSTPSNQLSIAATAVPSADQVSISNAGFPVTAAGVNGLQLTYVGGSAGVESAGERINLTPGGTAGGTWSALRIVAATTTTSTVIMNGVKLDSIGSGGPGLERGFFVDTGWDTAFAAVGVPGQKASTSLVQLGSLLSGGNVSGTFLSVNQTTSTGADFLNFQISSSSVFKIASSGAVSIGIASSSEGQLVFNNANTQFGVTLQANTSTAKSFTITLPNSTGTAGQVLVSDGSGNLSWDSTGFTKIASSTSILGIASTSFVVYTTATFTPANTLDQLWVTVNLTVSSTQAAAAASTSMAIFRNATSTAGNTCLSGTQVQVGNSVVQSVPRQAAGIASVVTMTSNVVDSPATTTTVTYGVCVKVNTINDATVLGGEVTIQEVRQGSDVAETYYAATDTPITAGDVVSLDPSLRDGVQQSQSAYESTLLGIVSTQPGVALGNSDPQMGVPELVALAGRVPVNVTNENGNINAGDYLTSSDIPGVAMRATKPGRIIAVAMESYAPDADPSEGTSTGSILGFVNLGWSSGVPDNSTSSASSDFSIGNDLQHFFGVVADVGSAVQSFIQASIIAVENLFVKTEVVLPGGSIKVPSGQDQISGQGVIEAGATDVFIPNAAVLSSSQIIVTPTSPTAEPLSVTTITSGSGFDVSMVGAQGKDVSFNWFMVGTYAIDSSTPSRSSPDNPIVQPAAPEPPVDSPPPDVSSTESSSVSSDQNATDTTSSSVSIPDDSTTSTSATDTSQ